MNKENQPQTKEQLQKSEILVQNLQVGDLKNFGGKYARVTQIEQYGMEERRYKIWGEDHIFADIPNNTKIWIIRSTEIPETSNP